LQSGCEETFNQHNKNISGTNHLPLILMFYISVQNLCW